MGRDKKIIPNKGYIDIKKVINFMGLPIKEIENELSKRDG